jgi:hypothetical protein
MLTTVERVIDLTLVADAKCACGSVREDRSWMEAYHLDFVWLDVFRNLLEGQCACILRQAVIRHSTCCSKVVDDY